jgi:excisionase family DNA binding protein
MNTRARLSELVERPEVAAEVSPVEIPGLLVQLAAVQAVLLSRLVVHGNGTSTPAPPPAPAAPDRLLSVDEAAAVFKVTRRWLYAHADKMGAHRLSRKVVRFPEAGLRKYLARLGR